MITCGRCRHANHGTDDACEGFLACPWIGGTSADSPCRVRFVDSGGMAFESFNGSNCSWRTDSEWRSVPEGFETRGVQTLTDPPEPGISTADDLVISSNDEYSGIRFMQNAPECLAFRRPESFLRRLWRGDDVGSGTLMVTENDLLFIRSNAAQRLTCCGPAPQTDSEALTIFQSQGGLLVPLDRVTNARIVFLGKGQYGFGKTQVADVEVEERNGRTTRFRFLSQSSAQQFVETLKLC